MSEFASEDYKRLMDCTLRQCDFRYPDVIKYQGLDPWSFLIPTNIEQCAIFDCKKSLEACSADGECRSYMRDWGQAMDFAFSSFLILIGFVPALAGPSYDAGEGADY